MVQYSTLQKEPALMGLRLMYLSFDQCMLDQINKRVFRYPMILGLLGLALFYEKLNWMKFFYITILNIRTINVLIGDMSVVGPRPEDINIVKKYYSEQEMKTLSVKPGIVSPGSIYNYTHSHLYLDGADVENSYIKKLLPVKLALEIIYIERMNFFYDLQLIWRTIVTIIKIMLGVKEFKDPVEYIIAKNRGIF